MKLFLEKVQFQAEEAFKIRENKENEKELTIKNLKDINTLDKDSQNLKKGSYLISLLSEKLVHFLENKTIALLVRNLVLSYIS